MIASLRRGAISFIIPEVTRAGLSGPRACLIAAIAACFGKKELRQNETGAKLLIEDSA
jgi:hypothetical protein